MMWSRRIVPALVFIAGLVVRAAPAAAQATRETTIKAAIVSKFPQFVEWPPAAVAGRATIDLCVVAGDAIQGALAQLVAGDTLNGRPLAVRRVDRDADLDGCQLLYLPSASTNGRRALLQRAAERPVLTVSDDQRFLDQGGIIALREVNGRLRFDVNATAARQAGLKISSQLLQLAVTVRGGTQ